MKNGEKGRMEENGCAFSEKGQGYGWTFALQRRQRDEHQTSQTFLSLLDNGKVQCELRVYSFGL